MYYSIATDPDSLKEYMDAVVVFKNAIANELDILISSTNCLVTAIESVDLSNLEWQINEISKIINKGSFSLDDLNNKIGKYFSAVTRVREIIEKAASR